MDGLLLQSRYKNPSASLGPTRKGWIHKHKFMLIIALNGQGIKRVALFPRWRRIAIVICRKGLSKHGGSARFAPGLVIQGGKADYPVLARIALRQIGCVGNQQRWRTEKPLRYVYLCGIALIANESPAFTI